MSILFDVVDQRGKQVICTEDCWDNHILAHHSNMTGREIEVEQAIKKPTLGIYQDAKHPDRNIYYRLAGRFYIKVVVSFDNNGKGVVITAFSTNNAKAGEKLIWPVSSQ